MTSDLTEEFSLNRLLEMLSEVNIHNQSTIYIFRWIYLDEETKGRKHTDGNDVGEKFGVTSGKRVQERFKRRDSVTFICGPSSAVTQGGHV